MINMTKKCVLCKDDKNVEEFNKKKSTTDGLQNICKTCSREKSKKYYQANITKHRKVVNERNRKKIKENRYNLFCFLKKSKCVDCGESDIFTLDFDHRDRTKKRANISEMMATAHSWDTILCEIEKCDVRCSNCHRKKTGKEFNWYGDFINIPL